MLLISRDSEHLQVWPDDAFAEQADVKPGGPVPLRFQFAISGFESSRPSQAVTQPRIAATKV
jgi:hypothetical protein